MLDVISVFLISKTFKNKNLTVSRHTIEINISTISKLVTTTG